MSKALVATGLAGPDDVAALVELHSAVAADLTRQFGAGHWSRPGTAAGVARRVRDSSVVVAREGGGVVGTLTLQTKKPWAIDLSLFTPVARRLFLSNMAVAPVRQRRGLGRRLLDEADRLSRGRGVDAICLDAYAGMTGAGPFYERCGYREVGRNVYRAVSLIYYERLLGT